MRKSPGTLLSIARTRSAGTLWAAVLLTVLAAVPFYIQAASGAPSTEGASSDEPHRRSAPRTISKMVTRSAAGSEESLDEESVFDTTHTVRPACPDGCPYLQADPGQTMESGTGTVATPLGTTYSVHHLVGGDVFNNGNVICSILAEDPPPGAPDDTVTYDGIEEPIRTDIFGTVPLVTESKTDNADGTHQLVIETRSANGASLFPPGVVDSGTGVELTDACFFVGLAPPPFGDPLDWPGLDNVTAASITYLSDGGIVAGPLDVTSLFMSPWNGLFGVTLDGGAGLDVDQVILEMLVEKAAQGPIAACCIDGECVGDIAEVSCEFSGGTWTEDGSCGDDPSRPPPVCDQAECGFNNGLPLDDAGGPVSQYAPNIPFGVGAADDFVLTSLGDNPCKITQVRAWMQHDNPAIDPNTNYAGINVTVYANGAGAPEPLGQPENDGTHSAFVSGGVVFTQTIPMSQVTAAPHVSSCVTDVWQLDIALNMVLNKHTRYWLEVQPILDVSLGRAYWMLSENTNLSPAQEFSPAFGIFTWTDITGNLDACPLGDPPTPEAGTRRNLAFQLFGEKAFLPENDDCSLAIPVGDGVLAYSNVGATIDGPSVEDECGQDFAFTQIAADIWFEYQASCTGDLTLSLCGSDYDTKIAVYDDCGRCPPQSASVACNEDFCSVQSEITTFCIGGERDRQTCDPLISPSVCESAVLNGNCVGGLNDGALCSVGDGGACPEGQCEPAVCGSLAVTEGACYRIRVGGFGGVNQEGKGLLEITCTPPPPPTGACCDFSTGSCRSDVIEADCNRQEEVWTEGVPCSELDPPCELPPPANDECVDCIPVETGVPIDGTTRTASGVDETATCAFSDTIDVWHCWTADCTGAPIITLCETQDVAFDTTIALFDACDGNELACNDDREDICAVGTHSALAPTLSANDEEVLVTEGETYYIRVSGWNNDTGDYRLLVEGCANACCTASGFCGFLQQEACESTGNVFHGPGSVCLGDLNGNNIDDVCEQTPENWVWKDNNGGAAGGYLPDFDQNKDYDNEDGDHDPLTGIDANYGGPAAAANSLVWFDGEYPDVGMVAPGTSKVDLIEQLATLMGTNGTENHPSPSGTQGPYVGTFIGDMELGINDYLAKRGLGDVFVAHKVPEPPPFSLVADEIALGRDVVLLLGFYRIENVSSIGEPPTGFVVQWRRTGGHYATVAGVEPIALRAALSDPDADAAEADGVDFVRGGDHDHDGDANANTSLPFRDPAYDPTRHNDLSLASHDVYGALPAAAPTPDTSRIPGGEWTIARDGDAMAYGEMMAAFHEEDAGGAFNLANTFLGAGFLSGHGYPSPEVGQIYTVVESAVIVSPLPARACCHPDGSCNLLAPVDCLQQGGKPLEQGAVCAGDLNQDGVDDACVLLGDLDGDADVDLDDWSLFVACLDGPAVPLAGGCEDADFNKDGFVDVLDAQLFFAAFTGSS